MKLTNKQHNDYCEILNDFRCKAIDIIEKLTKEYKNTLAEDIDSKLNNYHTHNEDLICKLENLRQENKQLKEQLAIREKALELICYYMEYKYWKKDDDIWYRKDKELYMYFIQQAKEQRDED